VLPGAEVRVDERIGRLLAEDKILTLGDRKQYLLLELPEDVFIDIEPLLRYLRRIGIEALIAHPERNAPALRHLQILQQWVEEGAGLQLTAASLLGWWGPLARQAAWSLVAEGWAGVLATDAHDGEVNRPCMTQAFRAVAARFGTELARLLCVVNPSRVLAGEKLIATVAWDRQEVG
jgi:protein-tyrosine phosphatase